MYVIFLSDKFDIIEYMRRTTGTFLGSAIERALNYSEFFGFG